MRPMTVLVASSATFLIARSRGAVSAGSWAALVGIVTVNPLVGSCCGVAWAAGQRRMRLAARRRLSDEAEEELMLLVHAMLIALSGGLGLASVISSARRHLVTPLGDAVDAVLRRGVTMGLGPALQSTTGHGAELFRQLGAVQVSGAPVVLALSSYAHELHEANRSRALQSARQLPVKLVIPLTLLMLPGFFLLAIGPTVLTSVARLLGPFGGP